MKYTQISQYKESVPHREGLMPMTYHLVDYEKNTMGFPMHWHEEFEIGLVSSGDGTYRIDGTDYHISEGDIIVISPKTLHSGGTGNQTMSTDSFVFHTGFLCSSIPDSTNINYFNPVIDGKIIFKPVISPGHPGHTLLLDCFLRLKDCHAKKSPYYEIQLKELLLHFFYLLFTYHCVVEQKKPSIIDENEEKTRRILAYLAEHFDEDIRIDTLADISGFSACHFMNTFKKYVGISCNKYMNHLRLDAAAKKLAETKDSIMNIATAVGYNNVSYFNRAFKNYFGTTPKNYRAQSQTGTLNISKSGYFKDDSFVL